MIFEKKLTNGTYGRPCQIACSYSIQKAISFSFFLFFHSTTSQIFNSEARIYWNFSTSHGVEVVNVKMSQIHSSQQRQQQLKYVEQKTDILGDVFVSQMQINQQQLGQISFQIMLLSAFNFLLSQQVFCISPERCYFFRRPGYFRQISRSHKMKTSLLQLEFRHAGALS